MIYREAGDFKTSYRSDNQTFPIAFDRWAFWIFIGAAYLLMPFLVNEYWAKIILAPFMMYAIAAIGLNILTGYCGQVSLGTGGFMAVGAYSAYKFMTGLDIWYPSSCSGDIELLIFCSRGWDYTLLFELPEMNVFFAIILGGVMTAIVGVIFGLPSLRIKGFYLAVATLAAQFFLVWLFNRVGWFYNNSASGQISVPEREMFGVYVTGAQMAPATIYLICLVFVTALALIARNLTRGSTGRKWMAIRDMDIAAEIIGVNPLRAKLTAFMVSSFFVGIAGAMLFTILLGAVEVGEVFNIQRSFLILFMIIIGGLGSILGSFLGAAFITLLPVVLKIVGADWLGFPTDIVAHFQLVILGGLIIMFLILEPHGLAQLWRLTKEKLRLWPFPH